MSIDLGGVCLVSSKPRSIAGFSFALHPPVLYDSTLMLGAPSDLPSEALSLTVSVGVIPVGGATLRASPWCPKHPLPVSSASHIPK